MHALLYKKSRMRTCRNFLWRLISRKLSVLVWIGLFPNSLVSRSSSIQSTLNRITNRQFAVVLVSNPMTGEILACRNLGAAFSQALPPGSTAKLVISVAALEEGAISPRDRLVCRRTPPLLGEAYHCSHPFPAPPFNLPSALANSCNCFFAALSERLTADKLLHWYHAFGFGTASSELGSARAAGSVEIGSTPQAKALASLGEKTVLVTPAQLLLAYSSIATGGYAFRLWLSSHEKRKHRDLERRISLRDDTLDSLLAGLEECVAAGTCQAAAVSGVRVAGKTGTATALDGSGRSYAWFVGFAPVAAPELALVIVLDHGTGARDAAPLAGMILKDYFERKRQGE
jgi:cell division protein FtsI/penicillin-binding protein 2